MKHFFVDLLHPRERVSCVGRAGRRGWVATPQAASEALFFLPWTCAMWGGKTCLDDWPTSDVRTPPCLAHGALHVIGVARRFDFGPDCGNRTRSGPRHLAHKVYSLSPLCSSRAVPLMTDG